MKDKETTYKLLKDHLIGTVNIAAVDSKSIVDALDLEWNDFEDCVQYVVSESIAADYIVTRNPQDYEKEQAQPCRVVVAKYATTTYFLIINHLK